MLLVALASLLLIIALMTVVWLISLANKNAGLVDVFWGPGFAVAGWLYYALTPEGYEPRKLLVVILLTVWALRLGLHLGIRNIGKAEDYRYAAWREANGQSWWWKSFFQVFLLQGLILWLVSMPLYVAQAAALPAYFTLWDGLGVVVWMVGFGFEAIGDWQLNRFKSNLANRGKVMRVGLWHYTRHPNYFGDATLWWGYFLLALSVPGGWLTVFSPILMTWLLMRVSGVAMLERNLSQAKPDYADYIAHTPAFFPTLFRRRKLSEGRLVIGK